MRGARLGADWHHLLSCASTNDEAQRLARAGAAHGTVVTADTQTRGRGRLGRSWFSPPGESLYLSVVLRPPLAPPQAPLLTLCAGVALAEAVTELLGLGSASESDPDGARPLLRLKWPNDLLLAPPGASPAQLRKAGGILTEMVCASSAVEFVVLGVGCNVGTRAFPPELSATSLHLCRPATQVSPPTVAALAERLLARLAVWYERYLDGGAAQVLRAFEQHAAFLPQGSTPPRPITVACGDRLLEGTPLGVDHDGALLLRDLAGTTHRIVAGEIVRAV